MTRLAYFDSFSGLVPVRILGVREGAKGLGEGLTFKLQATADRGAYRKGELMEGNTLRTIPRPAVYARCGAWCIRPYAWREILAPGEIEGACA